MRSLAGYSFEHTSTPDIIVELASRVESTIEGWIAQKCLEVPGGSSCQVEFRDGRCGQLKTSRTTAPNGSIVERQIVEPVPSGTFSTALATAQTANCLAVSCELSAGSTQLAPVLLEVHCPKVVRDILGLVQWTYSGTPLRAAVQRVQGTAEADAFISFVWQTSRALPVVAVAEQYGLLLHPGIADQLSADLAGLAVVGHLDPDASWRLTARKGKEWSCYGGAIRVYWPGLHEGSSPLDHQLWTAQRLLLNVPDTEAAASRIRHQIRRMVLGLSAFAMAPPAVFASIRGAARDEEFAGLQARIGQGEDYKAMSEEFFQKLVGMNEQLAARAEEIAALKERCAQLQIAIRWRASEDGELKPSEEPPPTTVEDAVLTASERFDGTLVFGADVNRGIAGLAIDAGPPDKTLEYLERLSELALALRKGPLGTTIVKWLDTRGVVASGESETIRNSTTEMRARTWDDGSGSKRAFELHLKPSDGTSPDRCVRVYFAYDEARQTVIVGWIGRHP